MSEMKEIDEEDLTEQEPELSEEDYLRQIALMISEKRSRAIAGRGQSGIEQEWLEDEEHYEGIDNTNRGEMSTYRSKPWGQGEVGTTEGKPAGSTIFFNITRPYVDAGDARVGDMLLPSNEKGWSIKPTPIPELAKIAEGKIPEKITSQINDGFQKQVDAGQMELEAGAVGAKKTRDDLVAGVKEDQRIANEKAGRAEKQIEDWHVESNFQAEMRLVTADAAKVGSGVLKGPIPKKHRNVAFIDGELVVQEEMIPVSVRVDPWNLYPDPDCGESIHRGNFLFETDTLTYKGLAELRGQGYIDEAIEAALKEGPKMATRDFNSEGGRAVNGLSVDDGNHSGLFDVWYFYGRLEKDDLEAAGFEVGEEYIEVIDVCITMVNNNVIKIAQNHLDTGEFPYDVMVWQRRQGVPWGIGISRQIREAQRVVNAAARNMMDNAGMAGGPMWIYLEGLVEPVDGVFELAPRKGWMAAEDADLNHLDNAFRFIEIPMRQQELAAIIEMGLKMAEDVTGMPLIMQGQQGKAPETVGGMQLLHNNASTVMRRIARLFDDLITEPHIRRYYRYLLQHGEDDTVKDGDFDINAKGSSALLERDAQNQYIQQMGELVMNPIFGLDPKKWMEQQLTSQRLDIAKFQYDDEEWKEVVAGMQQKPADPAVEVAGMKAEVEKMKVQLSAQLKQAELQQKTQSEDKTFQFDAAMKNIDAQIEQMKISGASENVMKKIQADLATEVMRLKTQKQLAGAEGGATQVAAPAVEPLGRADNGEAFEG